MTGGRGHIPSAIWDPDPLDDLIFTQLLDPREAATLNEEELAVLRANVRSEILFSEQIRGVLAEKTRAVYAGLKEAR